jgi:RNA polymerase primary sigma factor
MMELEAADRELTAEERREHKRGKRAQDQMVTCNLRLVVAVAKYYAPRCRSLDIDDLVQAGCTGLLRAVRKFDPSLGYKFSTYASYWLRQSMVRSMHYTDRNIRVPSHIYTGIEKYAMLAAGYVRDHGRQPPTSWLAEQMCIPESRVQLILNSRNHTTSLDTQNTDDSTILDVIQAPSSCEPQVADDPSTVMGCLQYLDPDDRRMLMLKHGIGVSTKQAFVIQRMDEDFFLEMET